jgi:hypothetical protein
LVDIFHYPFPLYRLFFCPANRVWGSGVFPTGKTCFFIACCVIRENGMTETICDRRIILGKKGGCDYSGTQSG